MLCACQAPQEEHAYSYCMVTAVEKLEADHRVIWVADCVGNTRVLFPRMIRAGDQVYYTPHVLDQDLGVVYGEIHSIQDVVP